jgi:hypothetical protein
MLEHWNKVQLMGVLSASLGLTRYLEVTTTTTGGKYAEARDLSFDTCVRLVYRMGASPSRDDLPIDFRSDTDDISVPLGEIRQRGLTFDLIFVDAHHTYECAKRDLDAAYALLEPGGVIVVHDCNPPTREVAAPQHHDGEWCGVTYKTFIDFCLGNPAIDYVTFDADYGCGVIMKPRNLVRALKNTLRARRQGKLKQRWLTMGGNFDSAYTLFDKKRKALLRLVDFAGLRTKLAGRR